ncbi:hypothetical protein MLD63_02120 (plasmid) [Paracoccus sp. TK19116]|uniref:Uncharacterized protein n=1 Tax=Paracoccus albicereus TaxID=2922394 RepID=A0ABT1MLS3_9RHOB|nr:hypothetical protein [Paracoccus albicereus]MCQ0969233.1 hypothetical protein [Paracoccus albicereus]
MPTLVPIDTLDLLRRSIHSSQSTPLTSSNFDIGQWQRIIDEADAATVVDMDLFNIADCLSSKYKTERAKLTKLSKYATDGLVELILSELDNVVKEARHKFNPLLSNTPGVAQKLYQATITSAVDSASQLVSYALLSDGSLNPNSLNLDDLYQANQRVQMIQSLWEQAIWENSHVYLKDQSFWIEPQDVHLAKHWEAARILEEVRDESLGNQPNKILEFSYLSKKIIRVSDEGERFIIEHAPMNNGEVLDLGYLSGDSRSELFDIPFRYQQEEITLREVLSAWHVIARYVLLTVKKRQSTGSQNRIFETKTLLDALAAVMFSGIRESYPRFYQLPALSRSIGAMVFAHYTSQT